MTISKNTNVNQRKSKHYDNLNISREKIQKRKLQKWTKNSCIFLRGHLKKKSLLKLKKVPFWWRKYYIENCFILAKRKRYLFGNTFLSQITITFETQKGLFLVKKKVPFQRYVFGTPLKSSFLDHKKVPFLVKKRSLFENGGTILMDFCFKKVPFIKKKVTFHHKNELFYLKKGTDWSVLTSDETHYAKMH